MKNLKKAVLASCFAIFSGHTFAIPTSDITGPIATAAQILADAALFAAQEVFMQELEEELQKAGFDFDEEMFKKEWEKQDELYKKQKEEDGYGWKVEVGNSEIYNESIYSENKNNGNKYIPQNSTDFKDVTNQYESQVDSSFREKHRLVAEDQSSYVQKSYDKELGYRKMLDKAYEENNKRFVLINDLRAKANSATTPQQKADIQLAISAEQTAIMNENLRLQTVVQMKEQEARLEFARLNKDAYKALSEAE